MQASPPPKRVRFGVFEADFSAGDLRKRGRRVTLQEQPFKVLALLLRQPGEVVTREELRQALWPADTFVDFDDSLNKAVQKLRQSLGDSAEKARYIETVARRGYRFIAPVEDGNAAATVVPTPFEIPSKWRKQSVVLSVACLVVLFSWAAGVGLYRWPIALKLRSPFQRIEITRLTATGNVTSAAISPDGKYVAHVISEAGKASLWLRQVGTCPWRIDKIMRRLESGTTLDSASATCMKRNLLGM
jgi:DNA-binding winged helix-turn-helix (wHTH) protein